MNIYRIKLRGGYLIQVIYNKVVTNDADIKNEINPKILIFIMMDHIPVYPLTLTRVPYPLTPWKFKPYTFINSEN